MADNRNDLAKARDEWQESDEARMLSSDLMGPVGGKSLRNRLEAAFIAGWEAHKRAATGEKA
jgi:hypothetical protein